ncbi:MAG: S8 family serine peptidase [bacterium]|nr:S8 family serine peptidase [bacterium]
MFKRALSAFLLSLMLAFIVSTPASVSAQQQTPVYILVVDDFGGNMRRLVDRVVQLPAYADTLRPLRNRARQLGAERYGNRRINSNTRLNLILPQQAQTAEPIRGVNLPGARLEVARASRSINTILRAEGFVSGGRSLEQDNCAIIPEGEGTFTTGGAGTFTTSGASTFTTGGAGTFTTGGAGFVSTPHGVRVESLLNDLKARYAPNAPIIVRRVDTEGFTTSVIINRITGVMRDIQRESPGAHIVINMSFAVVPCTTLGTLAAYDALMRELDPTVAADMAALQTFFNELVGSGLYDTQPLAQDAVESFLVQNCDPARRACRYSGMTGTIIPVAAAGNEGESFPYYPAAWPSVVSVSASTDAVDFVAAGPLAPYSNAGGVMMPGTWESTSGIELGTSFAAPRYSFLMALRLAGMNNNFCTPPGASIPPALPDAWGIAPPSTPAVVNGNVCVPR